ncbi:FCGR3 protein, partial [Rhabdornis inornatus]|nr:FCGR3 protein [Rhabdornis inornatus]
GPPCPLDSLVLQVPAQALLEGDTVTLCCQGWQGLLVTSVSFYHNGKELVSLCDGTQLSLSPLQLHHRGHYHCRGQVKYPKWEQPVPVTVTVTVRVRSP